MTLPPRNPLYYMHIPEERVACTHANFVFIPFRTFATFAGHLYGDGGQLESLIKDTIQMIL